MKCWRPSIAVRMTDPNDAELRDLKREIRKMIERRIVLPRRWTNDNQVAIGTPLT